MMKFTVLLLCWGVMYISGNDANKTVVGGGIPVSADNVKASNGKEQYGNVQAAVPITSPVANNANMHPISNPMDNAMNVKLVAPTVTNAPNEPTVTNINEPSSTQPATSTSTTVTTINPTNLPTTESTPTPSTTAAPTPTPTPVPSRADIGRWLVYDRNYTCIIAQLAFQFNVSYTTVKNETKYKILNVPDNNSNITKSGGKCGVFEQNLTIYWPTTNDGQDNVTLHFTKNDTAGKYSLHHVEAIFAPEEFPFYNSNQSMALIHNVSEFTVPLTNSYRCYKEQKFNMTLKNSDKVVAVLAISDLQYQAFRSDNTTIFGKTRDCAYDTPDIVPIAVGCALAGLVVIVLIAYLLGRRRSQARGYLSM